MREIATSNAPEFPDIPLSQAITANGFVFVSGQGPIDPDSGEIVGDSIEEQTRRTLQNVEAILAASERGLEDIVKITVYLQDMDDYDRMNATYGSVLKSPHPARTAMEPAELPADIMIEIDVIATTEGAGVGQREI